MIQAYWVHNVPKQHHKEREPRLVICWNLRFGDKTNTMDVNWSIYPVYTGKMTIISSTLTKVSSPIEDIPQKFLVWGRVRGAHQQNAAVSRHMNLTSSSHFYFKITEPRENGVSTTPWCKDNLDDLENSNRSVIKENGTNTIQKRYWFRQDTISIF